VFDWIESVWVRGRIKCIRLVMAAMGGLISHRRPFIWLKFPRKLNETLPFCLLSSSYQPKTRITRKVSVKVFTTTRKEGTQNRVSVFQDQDRFEGGNLMDVGGLPRRGWKKKGKNREIK
jgi:hypothetical protein